MKKFLKQLKAKRVQGAFVFILTFALQQFGVAEASELANSVLVILQALGIGWGVIGVVDAYPGHNGKPPA